MMDPKLKLWSERYQIPVQYFESLASTNTTAHQSTAEAGTIFLTDRQTAGKGQKGNRWESAPGENLTFSIVLHPGFLPVELQFYISKITALALTDTLEANGIEARIKWPNDMYVGDRKIAGILIENDLFGMELSRSIVGIGLNVNQTEFDPDIPNPTSVALEKGTASTPTDWLIAFYENFSKRYTELGEGQTDEIDRQYKGQLYRLNKTATYLDTASQNRFDAILTDVLPGGELILSEVTGGKIRRYLFKEVEFVLPPF